MRLLNAFPLVRLLTVFVPNSFSQADAAAPMSGNQVVERVSPAVVLILVGIGDGKVAGLGSGLIVRSEGVLLTSNHLLKDMREV